MGIAKTSFLNLWPRGKAHNMQGTAKAVLCAIGDSFDDVYDKIRETRDNAQPGKATFMLPEWCKTLGVVCGENAEATRLEAETVNSSTGGQTASYLNAQIQKAFPNVEVRDISISNRTGLAECGMSYCGDDTGLYSQFYYEVVGFVETDEQITKVSELLQRFAPLHLVPWSNIKVLSATGNARCRVGISGLAITGSDE